MLNIILNIGVGVPSLGPIRIEFILFALTLLGVALFHNQTMRVALIGLSSVLIFKDDGSAVIYSDQELARDDEEMEQPKSI